MNSFRQIEYFVVTAQTGQISKSAEKLHVSQSTITTAIKNLEEMLGVSLFKRSRKGVVLTYKGSLFLQHARQILTSMNEAMQISGKPNTEIQGEIRLAISFTISGYFLPRYYARFRSNFPGVKISLVETNRSRIEKGLAEGIYDLGLFDVSNLEHHPDFEYETILSSNRRLWVNISHPLLSKSSVSLKDVADYPYIMMAIDEVSVFAGSYWAHTPYAPEVIFQTNSVESVRSMVANGSGVTILADMVYRPWSLEGKRVEVITLTDEIPGYNVGLVWHTKKEKTEAIETFRKFLNISVHSNHSADSEFYDE